METNQSQTDSVIQINPELPKIFREKAIRGGTFLGGPLAAGYILAHNYKIFGEPEKAKKVWIGCIAFTVLLLFFIFKIPSSVKIPNEIIPLIYTGIASVFIHYYQGKQIEDYVRKGGQHFGGGRVAAVALVCILITAATIFGYLYVSDPLLTASKKEYGITNNEIIYKSSNISDQELDRIAASLKTLGLFGDAKTVSTYIVKDGTDYDISIPVRAHAWDETAVVDDFKSFRDNLQNDFPANHIIINMCSEDDIADIKKTLK